MSKEDIWNLFKLTGNTDYYLKYKNLINEGIDKIEYNNSSRNNNK